MAPSWLTAKPAGWPTPTVFIDLAAPVAPATCQQQYDKWVTATATDVVEMYTSSGTIGCTSSLPLRDLTGVAQVQVIMDSQTGGPQTTKSAVIKLGTTQRTFNVPFSPGRSIWQTLTSGGAQTTQDNQPYDPPATPAPTASTSPGSSASPSSSSSSSPSPSASPDTSPATSTPSASASPAGPSTCLFPAASPWQSSPSSSVLPSCDPVAYAAVTTAQEVARLRGTVVLGLALLLCVTTAGVVARWRN